MANWGGFIQKALTRFSDKTESSALPQVADATKSSTSGKLDLYRPPSKRHDREVKDQLSFQLYEKMRRRALNWKSYYYYDQFDIPRIAITNDNATGTYITDRRYFVSPDRVIDTELYTNPNASAIYVEMDDLQNVERSLFDQIEANEIRFQIYNRLFPLEIWYGNDQISNLVSLGRHKIYVEDRRAFLLRSFRNLGADGFTALSNRLLIQAGVSVDTKNAIEALLTELGNDELMRHYQSAVNNFNQRSAFRRWSRSDPTDSPLIITKTQQHNRSSKRDDAPIGVENEISEESYEHFAIVLDRHYSEIEEDLLYVSLSSINLDRSAVLVGGSALREKLQNYATEDLLEDRKLTQFYHFVTNMIEEAEIAAEFVREYSVLEDEAFQEIFVELIERIGEITSDYRYEIYSPISHRVDQLEETMKSLARSLEDAAEKQRRREINDKREILTQCGFESPNSGDYDLEANSEQISYYGKLLETQTEIDEIETEIERSIYDTVQRFAKSAFILTQINLEKNPDLSAMADGLWQILQSDLPQNDHQNSELKLIETLVEIAEKIEQNCQNSDATQLLNLVQQFEKICFDGDQFIDDHWTNDYSEFLMRLSDFEENLRQSALQKHTHLAEEIEDQFDLVETFISGVNVPALLPAQLHETGSGLQTFIVHELQKYLNSQNLQLQTVPGREADLRSLISELLPQQLTNPIQQIEHFFSCR